MKHIINIHKSMNNNVGSTSQNILYVYNFEIVAYNNLHSFFYNIFFIFWQFFIYFYLHLNDTTQSYSYTIFHALVSHLPLAFCKTL